MTTEGTVIPIGMYRLLVEQLRLGLTMWALDLAMRSRYILPSMPSHVIPVKGSQYEKCCWLGDSTSTQDLRCGPVQAYDKAAPVVKEASDTAAPYVKKGLDVATEVAKPVIRAAGPVVKVSFDCCPC